VVVVADLDGFVVPDALGLVDVDPLGAVVLDVDVLVLLGVDVDLFLPGLVLEADLVEALALMGSERMTIFVLFLGRTYGGRLAAW
jgi:hypothetical protein